VTVSDPVGDRVKKVLTERLAFPLDPAAIDDATVLRGQGLGLDSMDLVALIVELEQEFEVSFDDSELEEAVETFGSLADAVRAKLEASPRAGRSERA
jgi:acyl carrier protein